MSRTFLRRALAVAVLFFGVATMSALTMGSESVERDPSVSQDNTEELSEIQAATVLAPEPRIQRLKEFLESHPSSKFRNRALELIVSARAALGDERLRAGDVLGGIGQFRLAISELPSVISEKFFVEVASQMPFNLFVRGQPDAAREIARALESRVHNDPKRLIVLSGFYLRIEDGSEAARIAEAALKLAPETAAAYQALGAAQHIQLQLDTAVRLFTKALELDPKLGRSRRSLADLLRATGKPHEAVELYREQLRLEPEDRAAQAGIVLALFDEGRREEAEKELEIALSQDSRNFALLTGAAYWYATQRQAERALELARKAVEIEPRYVWSQIALARALLLVDRPVEAEMALRVARMYGSFPTLDYELATVLAAAGLYSEAATELQKSFKFRNDAVESNLAGRLSASSADFRQLIDLERRASLLQPATADTADNARILKALLAFTTLLQQERDKLDEVELATRAKDFSAGHDSMRAYRQIFVAEKLLRSGVALNAASELAEAAKSGVDLAVDLPYATIPTLAEELASSRAEAIAQGTLPNIDIAPKNVLANVLRGRIEDVKGWSVFLQGSPADAVVPLKRAVSVLPENSPWWRTATWHLGAALEATGDFKGALESYFKSYDRQTPDLARRAVIEGLYRRTYGSLDGLEGRLGPAPVALVPSRASEEKEATIPPSKAPENPAESIEKPVEPKIAEDPAPEEDDTPQSSREPGPPPLPLPPPIVVPSQTIPIEEPPPVVEQPGLTESQPEDGCLIAVSEEEITIAPNGGSALVSVSIRGMSGSNDIGANSTDWADVVLIPNSPSFTGDGSIVYLVTSVSNRTGTFRVVFRSPCGVRRVRVNVK